MKNSLFLECLSFWIPLFLLLWLPQVAVSQTAQNTTKLPVGSCTPDIPCSNGACCNGQSGFCGFGESFCGPDVCTSNCNAQAECGQDATPENFNCPLNVCCSQFGFCGTTIDFCGEGCQGNCGSPTEPSCGVDQSTATARRIGYYESWAASRPCMAFTPEQIPAATLTHINFAFALINPSFHIIEMSAGDSDLWKRTTALKKGFPSLKIFLSIGGWTFNDPPDQHIFSDMMASSANTNIFLASALSIMEQYAFDGLDIDWEYPGADDRGGVPADTENYVTFMKTVKTAFVIKGYGLTFTAPSSYWYLQHFDLPGMLEHADWVNVMTYDLHGVWDGVDPYIGFVVGAHTNLTEIDEAFQLYWRVGVNPGQMVMGMAFYGRSFTLSTDLCTDPGCPWTSGGNEGPCTKTSGSLMWNEIQSVITVASNPTLSTDDIAAVDWAVWDDNQWVSYDDLITFSIKMNYASSHCIGGTMIWSVDQDDNNYSRLDSLYPEFSSANAEDGIGAEGQEAQDGSCFVTDCGARSCYSDVQSPPNSTLISYIIGDVYFNPVTGNCDLKETDAAQVCCPTNMGGMCTKRGYKDATTPCNPKCIEGEVLVALDIVGSSLDEQCISGATAICCETTVVTGDCIFTNCSSSPADSCPSGFSNFETAVVFSSQAIGGPCSGGTEGAICCTNPLPYVNCEWRGIPPLCGGNTCDVGQITVFQDPLGDASMPCTGGNLRSYCCDPPVPLPAPFSDIFPSNVNDSGNDLFTVDFDEDIDPTLSDDGITSTFNEDDNENNGAFGEVFIDSPKPGSVSSLDVSSDWVITGCDAKSDQAQTALTYCSKANSPACQHVFIDGAPNTIVKLPNSCGLGPYARISSLIIHPDQSILVGFHSINKPASEAVYKLSFDYNFAAIPEANGPVYMRADVTDMPGYWDSVVDSPPERREWLMKRGLWKEPKKTKRWWGAFTTWYKAHTIPVQMPALNHQQAHGFIRDFHDLTETQFGPDLHCDGPPQFDASLDLSVTGKAQLRTRYGFYLQGQVVPPQVTAAYVYFSAGGNAGATFTLTGTASVSYTSDTIQFAQFGFPGLYYPGLLTLGPSLTLNGYVTGQVSLTGTMTTGLMYTFPEVNYALGKSGDNVGPSVTPSPPVHGYNYSFGYNVELFGDIQVHLVPTVKLGISVLGGSLIDADAFVEADLFAGIQINGSVNIAQAAQFCVNPHYGMILQGGVTGNVLYWESAPLAFPFFSTDQVFGSKCFGSANEMTISASLGNAIATGIPRREFSRDKTFDGFFGTVPSFSTSREAHLVVINEEEEKRKTLHPISSTLPSRFGKRASIVPPLVASDFLCPATDNQIGQVNADNDIYSDAEPTSNDDDGIYRRALFASGVDDSSTILPPNPSVKVASCGSLISFNPNTYSNTISSGYWNLASPTQLDGNLSPYTFPVGTPPGRSIYQREHVYEMQLLSMFIDNLATTPNLWQNSANNINFCQWANTQLNMPSPYPAISQAASGALSVIDLLKMCQPSNTLSSTLNSMPLLESTANNLKASAFSGKALKTQTTFNRYSFSKKVFVIRAAAGVISYLENGVVADDFVTVHQCVTNVWQMWYTAYLRDNTIDAPNRNLYNAPQEYQQWIISTVQQTADNLIADIQNMITWYSASAGGNDVQQSVDLNFGQLVSQGNAMVSATDLVQVILNPIEGTDFFDAIVSRL